MNRLFGLVGRKLGHSFSADYFNAKFRALNLPSQYQLFEFDQVERVRPAMSRLPKLAGLNVTIPYKEAILPFLDSLDETAAMIGAVNTIRIHDGHWRGFNTDAEGFYLTLRDTFGATFPAKAIILGNGGAARAVVHVLNNAGITCKIFARNPHSGQDHLEALTPGIVREALLVVQTTPVGMYPQMDEALPFPLEAVGSGHTLMDLIYNPEYTLLMRRFAESGARAINGLKMLHGQAEAAWKIWNET